MRVAIVYLGRNTPKYVFDNLIYLRTTFPKINLVFISDSKKSLNLAEKIGIKTWRYQENFEERTKFQNASNLPMNFRDGFWYTTTSRFFALEDYLVNNPGERLLQLEADVWASPNFPFEKFDKLSESVDIAFPLETEITGAASVLYLRDGHAARIFGREIRKIMSNDSDATDMSILGKLSINGSLNCVILPILPQGSVAINPTTTPENIERISKSFDYFCGVFDSVTYGLYLVGEDPRNHRGIHYKYRRQEGHLVYCDKIEFVARPDGIYLKDKVEIPLFNLHIHSKDRRAWKKNFLRIRVPSIILNSQFGLSKKRNYVLLLHQILKSIRRRLGI